MLERSQTALHFRASHSSDQIDKHQRSSLTEAIRASISSFRELARAHSPSLSLSHASCSPAGGRRDLSAAFLITTEARITHSILKRARVILRECIKLLTTRPILVGPKQTTMTISSRPFRRDPVNRGHYAPDAVSHSVMRGRTTS